LALAKVKKGKRRATKMISKKKTISTVVTKKKKNHVKSIDVDKKEEIDV
jgi:hypothetical protein